MSYVSPDSLENKLTWPPARAKLKVVPRKLPSAPRWAFHEPAVCDALMALVGPARADLLFTAYLLRAPEDQEGTKEGKHLVRVSHERINQCRGLGPTVPGSGKWLASYCERVGTTFTDHKVALNGPGKVRRIDVSFLTASVQVRPRRDVADFVHVVDRRPIAEYAVPDRIPFANEAQRFIVRYIESTPLSVYGLRPEAFERALAMCRDRTEENLLQECAFGTPFYEAAASGNTERLTAPGWSSVPKTIRRAATPDWIELDLTAAHFCIFERVCADHKVATPHLTVVLTMGGDTWANACAACSLPNTSRDAFKELAIKALYGMSRVNLREHLGDLPESVLKTPLLLEISRARNALARCARMDGYLRGVDRRKNYLRGSELSLIHSVCSDYELHLILPVYEVASQERDTGCFVALHQHDGVAIGIGGPRQRLEGFIARCQAAVEERAEALGVRTRLVAKTPLSGLQSATVAETTDTLVA